MFHMHMSLAEINSLELKDLNAIYGWLINELKPVGEDNGV